MQIYSFDDLDDMFFQLRKDMDEADLRTQPWQIKVKPGDLFVRNTPYGFRIYGKILPEEEPRQLGVQLYRLCEAYSQTCPNGEVGDIHVSTIERLLTQEEFDAVQARGWR